jgi:hypothetical protein
MKTLLRPLLFSTLCISSALAGMGDFTFSAVEKRAGEGGTQDHKIHSGSGATGAIKTGKEEWGYAVTITNNGFKDIAGLEARYVVFVKREQLGEKKGGERVERAPGSTTVESIKSHGKFEFLTTPVEMNKGILGGGWYYESGGKIKAEDKLCGLWLRLYQNGVQVAEFLRPTDLASKQKWE